MEQEMYNESQKERQKLFSNAIERKRLFKELKENPGFALFCKELETQLKRRFSDLVGFPQNLDKIVQNTYTSGEIAGIKLALEFVDSLIEFAQATIDMEKAIQERENNPDEAKVEGN